MRSRPEASVECEWWDLRSVWGMLLIAACRSLSCLHRDRYLVMEEWFVLKGWETSIFPSSGGARTPSPSVGCFLKCVFSNGAMWSLALSPRMTCYEELSPPASGNLILLVNGPLHFFFPDWLAFHLTDRRSTQLHPLVRICCASAVAVEDKGAEEARSVGASDSRAALPWLWPIALTTLQDLVSSYPRTMHSVNTHVKYYLGIFKCLATISFMPRCRSYQDL